MRRPWELRVFRAVRKIRKERDVVIHAARWLLDENDRLRQRASRLQIALADALAEVSRRPHPDDLEGRHQAVAGAQRRRIEELEKELDLADAARCRCGCRKPDTGPEDDARPGEW